MTWDNLCSKPINWFCCLRNCCYCLFSYLDQYSYSPSQISIALPLLLVWLSSLFLFSSFVFSKPRVFELFSCWLLGQLGWSHQATTILPASLPTPAEGCHVLLAPWGHASLPLAFTLSSHTSIKYSRKINVSIKKTSSALGPEQLWWEKSDSAYMHGLKQA